MNRAIQTLTQQVSKQLMETESTVEPFLVELVSKFVMLACYQDVSRNVQISDTDLNRLGELCVQILTIEQPMTQCMTALTMRQLGASISEFVSFFDLGQNLVYKPRELSRSTFAAITGLHNPDQIYGSLEQLLTDSVRPLALEQSGSQLAYGLKIGLNSILPRSDVVVFRDMLVKESQTTAAGQIPSGEKQLGELVEVTGGVCLVGDPPIQGLQAVEQQLVILQKQIEIQLNQQLGLYLSSILPLNVWESDSVVSLEDKPLLQRARQLILYQMNRAALIQSFSFLYKEAVKLAKQFPETQEVFKQQIQALQQLLKQQESIPKAAIYPKFAQVTRLYLQLQANSELLVQLKQWHGRLSNYLEDREFTPLPDNNAKSPLYSSEDVTAARKFFLEVYQKKDSKEQQQKEAAIHSRFVRLALQIITHQAGEKARHCLDLGHFQALDSEQLFDADCLFGGFDPVMLFTPSAPRPGLLIPSNFPSAVYQLQQIADLVEVQNPSLELTDNRRARMRPTASSVAGHLTTLQSPRGYETVAFGSYWSKEIFEKNAGIFLAYSLACSLASPDYLPLILLCNLPYIARLLNSVQLKQVRQETVSRYGAQFFDFLPLVRQAPQQDEPPQNGLQAMVYRNASARKLQVDPVGYGQRPRHVERFDRFLLSRLSELESQGSLFSSQFSVEGLLQSEVLSFYADLYAGPVFSRLMEYRRANYLLSPEGLVGKEGIAAQATQRPTTQPGTEAPKAIEQEIQTPLHFYDRFIDPTYTDSEWELRVRAMKLYQIQKKATQANQTYASATKVAGETQTVEKKDIETQSKTDAGTHAVQHFTYQRKPLPSEIYDSHAAVVRNRCQLELRIDLDQVKRDADRWRALREKAK